MRRALEPDDYPFFDYRRFTFSLGIAAGGSIWLSGNTASRFDPASKNIVVTGDLLEQSQLIHRKLAAALVAANRTLDDIVRVMRYVTPAALPDLPKLDALQKKTFGKDTMIGTAVVHSLLRADALIEIEAVANDGSAHDVDYLISACAADSATAWARAQAMLCARGAETNRLLRAIEFMAPEAATKAAIPPVTAPSLLRVISPRLVDEKNGSQINMAIAHGAPNVIYRSAEGDPAAGDVVGQCREVYDRLAGELKQAGANLDAVVKTTEFIPPAALADYRKTGDVRRTVFTPPYPAATGVLCERLLTPGALIAVEAIAVMEGGA